MLLLPPGLITWLSKHPVLTSYSMLTLPGSPRGSSPAQGTSPNPSGKPGCFLLAAKGWTMLRDTVQASLAMSPDDLLRWQVEGLRFWKPSGDEDRRGALSDTPSWTPATISGLFSLHQHSFAPQFLLQSGADPPPSAFLPSSQQFQHLPLDRSHCLIFGLPLPLSKCFFFSFNRSSSSAAFPSFYPLATIAAASPPSPLCGTISSRLFHPSGAHFSE